MTSATLRIRIDSAQFRSDIARLEAAARATAVAERIDALIASGSQVVESRYDPRDGCLRLQLTEQFASLLAPRSHRQA
jgi:hypothetical protein